LQSVNTYCPFLFGPGHILFTFVVGAQAVRMIVLSAVVHVGALLVVAALDSMTGAVGKGMLIDEVND
jgi:hypothetical protein